MRGSRLDPEIAARRRAAEYGSQPQKDVPNLSARNIRQLQNAIEAAFTLCERQITEDELTTFHRKTVDSAVIGKPLNSPFPIEPGPHGLLSAQKATRWNKTKTAELLQSYTEKCPPATLPLTFTHAS